MTQTLVDEIMQAVLDPGSFTKRGWADDHYEYLNAWQRRAVEEVLAPRRADVPTLTEEDREALIEAVQDGREAEWVERYTTSLLEARMQ